MTLYTKMFVVTIVLAVGLGLAFLFGKPDTGPWHQNDAPGQATSAATIGADTARLLPGPNSQASITARSVQDISPIVSQPSPASTSANRRPVWLETTPQASISAASPTSMQSLSQSVPVQQAGSDPWTNNSRVRPAADSIPKSWQMPAAPTQQATFHTPSTEQHVAKVTAPPLMGATPMDAEEEIDAPRSHIVRDGDSLPRLADRYLDDPDRSMEIYMLNQDVLPRPDLLPIGVELKLPARVEQRTATSSGTVAYEASIATEMGGMVPVAPIPASADAMPRAQLMRPMPASFEPVR